MKKYKIKGRYETGERFEIEVHGREAAKTLIKHYIEEKHYHITITKDVEEIIRELKEEKEM